MSVYVYYGVQSRENAWVVWGHSVFVYALEMRGTAKYDGYV